MGWQLHEPGEPAALHVADGEQVFHVRVWWPEYDEPLDAEVAARDHTDAQDRALEAFGRIPGREPILRVDTWTLEEWVTG